MSEDWVVMFVDMQGSTKIKYTSTRFVPIIGRLRKVIAQASKQSNHYSPTGDGAMIGYKINPKKLSAAPLQALRDAVEIIQEIDILNYKFLHNELPIHIRIGIATGQCESFLSGTDLIGTHVDLAARLCAEAETDKILVDKKTLSIAKINPSNEAVAKKKISGIENVKPCDRRLSLKGVPLVSNLTPATAPKEKFYDITVDRFSNRSNTELISNGLLALYRERSALERDFSPRRLIEIAEPESTILVAGRTLLYWAETVLLKEVRKIIAENKLTIKLMIASEHALRYVDTVEQEVAKRDLIQKAIPSFQEVLKRKDEWSKENPEGNSLNIFLYMSDFLIMDGVTCVNCHFKYDTKIKEDEGDKETLEFSRLITLQDINANAQETTASSVQGKSDEVANDKATILWSCTCQNGSQQRSKTCKAHGLEKRTEVIFNKATQMTVQSLGLNLELMRHGDELSARKNHPRNYLPWMASHYRCIREERFTEAPPPFCVQLQVSTLCSTHCRMCDQHETKERQMKALTLKNWESILSNLARFGVKTVIFSGGEPLERADIADLLQSAHKEGLRIGLLTNGMLFEKTPPESDGKAKPECYGKTKAECDKILQAIADYVDWVAISVDGNEAADRRIRPSTILHRPHIVRSFCEGIRSRNNQVNISATVTLQPYNIQLDMVDVCRFINGNNEGELNIPKVNFKFATGASAALSDRRRKYISTMTEIQGFFSRLTNSPLLNEQGNSLAYLMRSIENKVFNVEDIADGAPVKTHYSKNKFRCFTPFLFSLIDYDGKVYPCCHLYRDNHVLDAMTDEYREKHCMGDLANSNFDFGNVWNGKEYANRRTEYSLINPKQEGFEPCGECTRHCQHNSILTKVEKLYNEAPVEMEKALKELGGNYGPVWF